MDVAGPLIERSGEPLETALLVSQHDIGESHRLKVECSRSLLQTIQHSERVVATPQPRVRQGHVRRLS